MISFLLVLVVLPLIVIVLGILWVTPVRQTTSTADQPLGPTVVAVPIQGSTILELTPTSTMWQTPAPDMTSTDVPQPPQTPVNSTEAAFLSLNPWSATALVALPGLAGLLLLIGAGVVTPVLKEWQSGKTPSPVTEMSPSGRSKRARLRYVLLAFVLWIALSIFLILDLAFTVSLHIQFVAIYVAFWVLVGALLLHARPTREKLLILTLLVVVLLSIRFINWNSRKPFLRDLYRIKEGMIPVQVEQLIGGYIRGGGRPVDTPATELDERGEIVRGTVTYRHTDESWGDSDWGVVVFEDGRVKETLFLPD